MPALFFRSSEFTFYAVLLRWVDWVSRLPRETQPDAMRLYRENVASRSSQTARSVGRGAGRCRSAQRLTHRARATSLIRGKSARSSARAPSMLEGSAAISGYLDGSAPGLTWGG